MIKDLELKFLSRTTREYKTASEPPPKDTKQEDDPHLEISDALDQVSFDKLLDAEDKLK